MPKKVFELAAELGMGAIDLVEKVKSLGMSVKNHMATLSDDDVERIISLLGEEQKKQVTSQKKAVKKVGTSTGGAAVVVAKKKIPTTTPTISPSTTVKKNQELSKTGATPTKSSRSSTLPQEEGGHKKRAVIRRKVQDHSLQDREEHRFEDEEPITGELFSEVKMTDEDIQDHDIHIGMQKDDIHGEEEKHEEIMSEDMIPRQDLSHNETVASGSESEEEDVVDRGAQSVANISKGTTEKTTGGEDYPELRGLQVVYRPPVQTKTEMNVESQVDVTSPEKKAIEASERKEEMPPQKKKVYLDEKMHSFTPIYIPPKKVVAEPDLKKKDSPRSPMSVEKEKVEGGAKFRQIDSSSGHQLSPLSSKGLASSREEDDGRKRMGGLAAIMAKPKGKVRDLEQLRADEELKTYNVGLVGKAVYTPVGRKKIYTGSKKETLITETKESKRFIGVHFGLHADELCKKLHVKFDELRDRCLEIDLLVKPKDYLGLKLLESIVAIFQYKIKNLAFNESHVIQSKKTGVSSDSMLGRPPVVTIMGHVDHGKTSLLDYIRRTKVAAGEAGGITQHLGAYTVSCKGQTITFIDTPGHAAFTSMRERGASATDIVVLVVAADDGVMPQTRESVRICQASQVPIIVAVNKMDKEGVDPERIKQSLLNFELTPEEWGGDTQYVPLSALTGMGVDQLLESILIQAEVMDLKANVKGPAEGVVLESHVEVGRGPVVTVLVQAGELKTGQVVVVGEQFGRARSLMDPLGRPVKSALPSYPVQILGLDGTPKPGDKLHVVSSEKEAKLIVDNRVTERKELASKPQKKKVALEDFLTSQKDEQGKKILRLVLRADVSGSYEALKSSLEKMGNDEVGVEIVVGGTGAITDNDIQLADSLKGVVIGFNMRPVTTAQRLAEEKGVDVRTYRIIYELLDDVKLALEGLLEPDKVEKYIGRAEVRNIFVVPKVGTIAGSAVVDGKIERGCSIRLLRDGKIIHDGKISTLKRFKDDVKEVKSGYECGIALDNYGQVQINDIFEAYIIEHKKRLLELNEAQVKMF
jgi:translation initiation factor IF-2